MEVNVHHAKTHLSQLIIDRNGKLAVRLIRVMTKPTPAKLLDRVPGRLAGKLILPPDWEKQWAEFDHELADLMIDAPISNDRLPGKDKL